MKPRDPKVRSREALREAVDRYGREHARVAARGPEPWPGDLYVLEETAGFPVEWLVVDRTPGPCRLVATDTNPALGSTDVPVPAEVEGGPLSVRCAVSLQVGVETLRRGERTGTVAPEILDPVRRRLEELAAGSLDAAPDPELEDWHAEVLAPARAALLPPQLKAPGPPPRHFRRRAVAVAAIFLRLAALGGLSALAWQFHRGELQARSEIDRLVHERQALESEHQRQLAALREIQAAQEQRPPEPPPPVSVPLQPLINLVYAVFYPGETRGALREIAIPDAATHLFLLFYVGDQAPCTEYELAIVRRGAPLLTVKELKPLPGKEVSVAVPRAQLSNGSYQFRLRGMCEGERRELGVYEARLKEEAR
ncbi:MAG TPA: hypothetical protein VKM72_00995 [Thermoanaerobaculia bacterium]|nr:hypothetical protein [Thermoanaerobaculia bacterium]